jgi:hypothetical protein
MLGAHAENWHLPTISILRQTLVDFAKRLGRSHLKLTNGLSYPLLERHHS